MLNIMNTEKMSKFAKTLKKVISVFYVASLIGIAVSVVFAAVSFILDESIFSIDKFNGGGFSIDITGMIRYDLSHADLPANISMINIYRSIAYAACVYFIALSIVFRQLRDILSTVSEKDPFNEKNAGRLSAIGGVLLVGSVLFSSLNAFVASSIVSTLRIENINIVSSLDLSMSLTGFLILILAGIFKYGCYLQKEHDATV